mmetsp:Transcript_6909/g.15795  ORF Transcript_6909/g.15795 Transcript_6909/m.15795 type:complete len:608 (+) Transcript_6909:166-1989(+)
MHGRHQGKVILMGWEDLVSLLTVYLPFLYQEHGDRKSLVGEMERVLAKLYSNFRRASDSGRRHLECQLRELVSLDASLAKQVYTAGDFADKSLLYHVCTLVCSLELMQFVLDAHPEAAGWICESESSYPSALSTLVQRGVRPLPLRFVGELGEAGPIAYITPKYRSHRKGGASPFPSPTVKSSSVHESETIVGQFPHLLRNLQSLTVARSATPGEDAFPVETMRQLIQSRCEGRTENSAACCQVDRLLVQGTFRRDDPVEFRFEDNLMRVRFPALRHEDLTETMQLRNEIEKYMKDITVSVNGTLLLQLPAAPVGGQQVAQDAQSERTSDAYWQALMDWISQLSVNKVVLEDYAMTNTTLQRFVETMSRCRSISSISMTSRKLGRATTEDVSWSHLDLSSISQMTQVRELSFFRSKLGRSLVDPIVALLLNQQARLSRLELQWNYIPDEGIERIVDTLGQHNHSLKMLRCNQLEEEACRILLQHLKNYRNCTLERVYDRTRRVIPFKLRQLHAQIRYYCDLNAFGRGGIWLSARQPISDDHDSFSVDAVSGNPCSKETYVDLIENLLLSVGGDHLPCHLRLRRTDAQILSLVYGLVRENPIVWATER